ncbi:MAG: hypothetical protein AAF389_05205 [Gemmatimonadota bacterium]
MTSNRRWLFALPLVAMLPGTVEAQTAEDFDESRAYLGEAPMFDAFYPEAYEPLSTLLRDGRVDDDTAILRLRRGDTTLTLITNQMSYHHIAQGELAGEPWMVSF